MTEQVVLFLVDGMRPDGLQQAETPNVDRLIASGASTMSARTVMPSVTLPCHMSLFHSVGADRHGITTNTWMPQVRPIPGLTDALHAAGKTTAAFFNWEELRDLSRPGSLDHIFFSATAGDLSGAGDREIAKAANQHISEHQPNFAFVYLGCTDETGHAHGWMTDEYLNAISNADRCIGTVLEAMREESVAVVIADHGGHEKTHGTPSDEDMTIPVVISRQGQEARRTLDQDVQITDIAPTIVSLLSVEAPAAWIGSKVEI
jgi:predicted AlkP superfamily pyrophosphatase or phosphodiesterase